MTEKKFLAGAGRRSPRWRFLFFTSVPGPTCTAKRSACSIPANITAVRRFRPARSLSRPRLSVGGAWCPPTPPLTSCKSCCSQARNSIPIAVLRNINPSLPPRSMPASAPRPPKHFLHTRASLSQALNASKTVIGLTCATCGFRAATQARKTSSCVWISTAVFRFGVQNCVTPRPTPPNFHLRNPQAQDKFYFLEAESRNVR